jgi:hypothetical protein
MNHPFALNLSDLETVDLEFEEHLNSETDAQIEGGMRTCGTPVPGCYTDACNEGGGYGYPPFPGPCYEPPKPPCYYPMPKPPVCTTMAYGEEGGCVDYCM